MIPLLTLLTLSLATPSLAQNYSISDLRAEWNLDAAGFSFAMPSDTQNSSEAQKWIRKNWDLVSGIGWGGSNIVFSPDPSTSTSTLVRRQSSRTSTSTSTSTQSVTSPASTDLAGEPPVLRTGYPQGSYSKRTGGTQFYAAPLNSTSSGSDEVVGNSTTNGQYERMLLSYDIWFPSGFAWNMGGKLPGLRGGSDTHGCSGGNETDGTTCFSTRLMWRTGGEGEVYAYIPTTQKNFCSQSEVTCNSDYGTSLGRGTFSFATGQWQTITQLVVLNSEGRANGVVKLYYNGVLALSFTNLELRKTVGIASVGGMFFSTFFGGDDATWATPTQQYTYFRNLQLYAGYGASNGTGGALTSGTGKLSGGLASVIGGVAFVLAASFFGLSL